MSALDAIAAAAVERSCERLASAMAAALPDATIERTPGGVVVRGRAMLRRTLDEAALAWPAGLLK